MKNAIALLLFAFAAQPGTALAAEIRQRVSYFTVTGSTLEQIDQSLARNGPIAGGGDTGHPGATSVAFDGHIAYEETERGCRVSQADFSLDIEVILPRWKKHRLAEPETVLLWETLERDVARHEQRHADIARNWATRMEMAVRNLGTRPTCAQMEETVMATTRRYLDGHENEQRSFDRKEASEMSLRLKRQLRDRLRDDAKNSGE